MVEAGSFRARLEATVEELAVASWAGDSFAFQVDGLDVTLSAGGRESEHEEVRRHDIMVEGVFPLSPELGAALVERGKLFTHASSPLSDEAIVELISPVPDLEPVADRLVHTASSVVRLVRWRFADPGPPIIPGTLRVTLDEARLADVHPRPNLLAIAPLGYTRIATPATSAVVPMPIPISAPTGLQAIPFAPLHSMKKYDRERAQSHAGGARRTQ